MEETLTDMAESIEELQTKFYGVVTGKVINLADPMFLGRVQVQLPFIDSVDLSPWARVATLMAGVAHGTYFIPSFGDEVLIAFEHGDVKAPYVIGSLWNAASPPPLPSPIPQLRVIKTLAGNEIIFSELPPTITIKTPVGQLISMSALGITISTGGNVISMTPEGVSITAAPNISLKAAGSIDLTAPNVTINGAAATNIKSGGVCNVSAPMVKIN